MDSCQVSAVQTIGHMCSHELCAGVRLYRHCDVQPFEGGQVHSLDSDYFLAQ